MRTYTPAVELENGDTFFYMGVDSVYGSMWSTKPDPAYCYCYKHHAENDANALSSMGVSVVEVELDDKLLDMG